MDKILHDLKDSKLWELWYIPYYGSCRILSINRGVKNMPQHAPILLYVVGCPSSASLEIPIPLHYGISFNHNIRPLQFKVYSLN